MPGAIEAILGIKTDESSTKVILLLLYTSNEDGKLSVVTKFAQRLDIPNVVLGSKIPLVLYVREQQHAFPAYDVLWDQKLGVIVHVVWPKADDFEFLTNIREDNSWSQGLVKA